MKTNWMIGMVLASLPVNAGASSGLNLSQLDSFMNCPQCETQCMKKAQFAELTSSQIRELKPVLLAKSKEFEKLSERVRKTISKELWEQISEYQWRHDFGSKLAGRYGGDLSPELTEFSNKLLKSLWSLVKSSAEDLGISVRSVEVVIGGGNVILDSVSSEGNKKLKVSENLMTGVRKGFVSQKEDYLIPNATVLEALGLEYVGYEFCPLPLYNPSIYSGTMESGPFGAGMPFGGMGFPEIEVKAKKAK